MIHGIVDDAVFPACLAVDLANRLPRKKSCHGVSPQSNNYIGTKQSQLTVKPLLTCLDLYWQGVSVAGWPTFEDVAYVDFLPLHSNQGKQFIKKLPSRTHKRTSLLVFMPARSFTNEYYGGFLCPFTGDRPV